jgi:hypothetical protein
MLENYIKRNHIQQFMIKYIYIELNVSCHSMFCGYKKGTDLMYVWIVHFGIYGLGLWCLTSLSTIFQFCHVRYIGAGNWSNWRKPPTCCQTLINFMTQCCIQYTLPHDSNITTLEVIGTDCIDSCKSNYHRSWQQQPLVIYIWHE